MVDPAWDPLYDMEAEEVLKWLFRHQATLAFDREEDGDDMLTLTVGTQPEGSTATLKALCRAHELVPEITGRLVADARARFLLE